MAHEQKRHRNPSQPVRYDGDAFLYPVIGVMFFASGFAALIYQIIWQRALFAIFGINGRVQHR